MISHIIMVAHIVVVSHVVVVTHIVMVSHSGVTTVITHIVVVFLSFAVVLVINVVGFDQWWASPFAILKHLGDGSILFAEHILNLDSVCACWYWILGRAYSIHTYIELEVFSFKAELDASTWINKHKLQDAFLVRSDASQLVELVVHIFDVGKVAIGISVICHAMISHISFAVVLVIN